MVKSCGNNGLIYSFTPPHDNIKFMNQLMSNAARSGFGLFDTIPEDILAFGIGNSFDAKRVPDLLSLKKEDVSRLASVSVKSVRYDAQIPEQVRERLEEIANTINMVAKIFNGDKDKTVAWFRVRNPLLGDVSPRDMIRLGKYDRLRKFIISAMSANSSQMGKIN